MDRMNQFRADHYSSRATNQWIPSFAVANIVELSASLVENTAQSDSLDATFEPAPLVEPIALVFHTMSSSCIHELKPTFTQSRQVSQLDSSFHTLCENGGRSSPISRVTVDEIEDLDLEFADFSEEEWTSHSAFAVVPESPVKKPETSKPKKVASPVKSKSNSQPRVRKVYKPDKKEYVTLSDLDVLHGRGHQVNQHPGNVAFHDAKNLRANAYREASNFEKTRIAQELVDAVHSYGGRFVEKDEVGWYIAHPHAARTKASQALRDTRLTKEERRIRRQEYRQKLK